MEGVTGSSPVAPTSIQDENLKGRGEIVPTILG